MRWFVILAVSSVVIGTSAVVLTVVIFWQFIFGIILALLLYTLLLLRAECKVCPEAKRPLMKLRRQKEGVVQSA